MPTLIHVQQERLPRILNALRFFRFLLQGLALFVALLTNSLIVSLSSLVYKMDSVMSNVMKRGHDGLALAFNFAAIWMALVG